MIDYGVAKTSSRQAKQATIPLSGGSPIIQSCGTHHRIVPRNGASRTFSSVGWGHQARTERDTRQREIWRGTRVSAASISVRYPGSREAAAIIPWAVCNGRRQESIINLY